VLFKIQENRNNDRILVNVCSLYNKTFCCLQKHLAVDLGRRVTIKSF